MTIPSKSVLSPEHAQMLAASGIAPEVIAARGYQTITTKAELKRLGFGEAQCATPTLLIPIWGPCREVVLYHHRPDAPRMRDGKPAKYEFPARARMAIDVPPDASEGIRRPDVPLFITEGAKKADAAVSAGLCCIAVIGTWNWRGTNEHGGKTTLPELDEIAWKDTQDRPRSVYLVYDSDVMLKEQVYRALVRFTGVLEARGASVRFVYLPHGADGRKVGLDDYLAAGHSTDELLALATGNLRPPPTGDRKAYSPYLETPGGLVRRKPTQDGPVDTPLANFTARIVADVIEDDGAETRRFFEIEVTRAGHVTPVSVPASAFALMNWPMEHLGPGALLYPGLGTKDHTRAAIQILSNDPPARQVFAHTGWRHISDQWAYLHGGGAVGAAEPAHVRLPPALEHYILPEPPIGDRLKEALRASLDLRNLISESVSLPILGGLYRAALGTCDFSLHLAGQSGAFKSELAALAQQHFGPKLDARHLPGNWSSTDNALEGLAFTVKDGLVVLDDFAPCGTAQDVQRLHSKADRVLRGQGNNAGRIRMRADATLKAPKYPRGLILSTGEDVPLGLSLRARLLVLEIAPGAIDSNHLSLCQARAADGLYAEAMSGFLAWIAPQYEDVQAGLRGQVSRLRNRAAASGLHRRTPEIVGNLAVGLEWLLRCALDVGAISETERDYLWKRGWDALGHAAQAQTQHQAASEPTRRFLELLSAALASGKAHLARPEGDEPKNAEAWGWREHVHSHGNEVTNEWRSQGERIGWIDGANVYLQPDAAYNIAKRIGADGGDGITLAPRTLHKRLHERRLLASTDEARRTNTIRRTLESQRRDVLHLHASRFDSGRLMGGEIDQSDQSDQANHVTGSNGTSPGQSPGQFREAGEATTAPQMDRVGASF